MVYVMMYCTVQRVCGSDDGGQGRYVCNLQTEDDVMVFEDVLVKKESVVL